MCSISHAKRIYILFTIVLIIIMALFGYCNIAYTKQLLLQEKERELVRIANLLNLYLQSDSSGALLSDGIPGVTVLYPPIINGQMVGYSWINTKTEGIDQVFRAVLWSSVAFFFLIWASNMLILRYTFQRIDQNLQDDHDRADRMSDFEVNSGYVHADTIQHSLEQGEATFNQPLNANRRDWIFNVTPIYSSRRANGAIAMYQDITATVRLEHERLLALERFEKLFRNNPAAMAVYKAADQTYIDVNATWERMTSYTWDEVLGRNPVELGIVDSQAPHAPAKWQELTGDGVYHGEFNFKTKHGVDCTAAGSIILIDGSHYLATFVDVTDQQRMRSEAARLAQLEALGEMAACIAHEINQPLNSLQFVADAALYWYTQNQPPSPKSIIESLEIVRSQANKIDSIIQNVRSVIQHGKLAQEKKPVNINEIVAEALQVLKDQLDDLTIMVQTDLSEKLPPAHGTSVQIEEIVMNLVTNAIQALMYNPVDNRIIKLTTYFEDGIILDVTDNGPGVSVEIANSIFDSFYTTREHDGGMGVGLALARRIVELFNGSLELVPTERGATFRLKLIAYKEAERSYENLTC